MILRTLTCLALLGGSAVYSQATLPAQEPPIAASASEVAALRREVAELKAEIARMKAQQPVAAAAATAKPQPARAEPIRAQPAPALDTAAPVAPIAAPLLVPAPMVDSHLISVTDMKVSSDTHDGKPGITVAASVTLKNVPNVQFTFQAVLVTSDGLVHTDIRGKPYSASREIKTGDEEDKDDYSVWIDLSTLFSSRPPEDLYVQVRVLDITEKVVATSGLGSFKRPWK